MSHISEIKAKDKVIIGVVQLPMGVTHLSVTHLPRQTFNQPIGIQGAAVRERGVKDAIINISTVFAGNDINKTPKDAPFSDLRSLIVELRNIPFLPIYSSELFELVKGNFDNINLGSGGLNIMSVGLTVAVQSVRLSSIQGHPNAVQVDMSFMLTNMTPATGGLVLFKDKTSDGSNNPQIFMYSSNKIANMVKTLRDKQTAEFKISKVNGRKVPSMTLSINAERGIAEYTRYINMAIKGDRLVQVIGGLKSAMAQLSQELTRASEAISNDQYKRSLLKDVMAFSASFTNTLVPITLSTSPIPTHQYLGSSPIQFKIGILTADSEVVKNIVGLHDLVLKMSKALWFFHGYLPLKVESPLTGLLNVDNISITGIDFGSVDGNSNSYQVEIDAISNDVTDYIEQLNQAGTVDLAKLMNAIAEMENFKIDANGNWIDVANGDTTNGAIPPSVEDDMKAIAQIIRQDVDTVVNELAIRYALQDPKYSDSYIANKIRNSEIKANTSIFKAFANAVGGEQNLGLNVSMQNDTENVPKTQYKCTDVIDGDTIKVMKDGQATTIRLANVDAQETLHLYGGSSTKPTGPYAEEAKQYVQQLVNNANSSVMIKNITTDLYGRQVAEVYVKKPNGETINVCDELLKKGYAVPFMPQDPQKACNYFSEAFKNRAGMFSNYDTAPIYTPSQLIGQTAALDGQMGHVRFTVESIQKQNNYYYVSGNNFTVRVPINSTLTEWMLKMHVGMPVDVYGQLVAYNDALTIAAYIPEQMQDVSK